MDTNKDCSEKLAFETKSEAEGALLAAEYLHGIPGELKVYYCKHCSLYHFSSS